MQTAKELSREKLNARVEDYARQYPDRKLYFTSDGNCFLDKSSRDDHAYKAKVGKLDYTPEKPVAKEEGMTAEEATKTLLGLEINNDTDYTLAHQLVKALGIETASNKKDDVFYALEFHKEQLKNPAE
ncbi:MAG: hypothetical protein HC896_00280 [Bacteroidales bacterium]|nr:hypothetical protein [Bacteroidales bacterium]